MPTDRQFKVINSIHQRMIKMSGGRLGGRLVGLPILELTTIGRKSGQPHTVVLTSPLQLGGAIVVVASRGGDDRHPAWFLNLQDRPDVTAAFAGQAKRAMRAGVASPTERAAMWPRVIAAYKGYASYQAKTEREIPLVLLKAVDDDAP